MNTYYLRNVHNGTTLEIKAFNWEIQSFQHTFIGRDSDSNLVFGSYSTKNWDVVDVLINK